MNSIELKTCLPVQLQMAEEALGSTAAVSGASEPWMALGSMSVAGKGGSWPTHHFVVSPTRHCFA